MDIHEIFSGIADSLHDAGLDFSNIADAHQLGDILESAGVDLSGMDDTQMGLLLDALHHNNMTFADLVGPHTHPSTENADLAGSHTHPSPPQFGAETADKSDLIISADGTGYKSPSDYVSGNHPFRPANEV